jgi:type II secretory pathway component PulF
MALYSYEAFSKDGKKVHGAVDAPSAAALKEQLARQGLFPTKIELAGGISTGGFFSRLFEGKVTIKDKILFTKQLAVLLKAGVPILQAIELLIEQFEGGAKTMLVRIKDDIKEGTSLADALAKYPKIFENLYVQLVRAGESTGKLDTILERLTMFLERREAIGKKVKSAMQQPIIQLVIAVGVVGVLVVKVVPSMAKNFTEQKIELPWITTFILSTSDFLIDHYLLIIGSFIAIISLFKLWKSSSIGSRQYDQLKLKLPLIKSLSQMNAVVQFSYTLGLLLEGGVNIAEALDIVVSVIDNQVLASALRIARDNIVKEGKIAEYLKQTKMFPPIAIYLIKTGEETGQLDKMLLTVADNYEKDYVELMDTLTGLISPIMLIVMAAVVGVIVMAVAMPMMQMLQTSGM